MRIVVKSKKGFFEIKGFGYERGADKSFAFDSNKADEQIEIFPSSKFELQQFIKDLQILERDFDKSPKELE